VIPATVFYVSRVVLLIVLHIRCSQNYCSQADLRHIFGLASKLNFEKKVCSTSALQIDGFKYKSMCLTKTWMYILKEKVNNFALKIEQLMKKQILIDSK